MCSIFNKINAKLNRREKKIAAKRRRRKWKEKLKQQQQHQKWNCEQIRKWDEYKTLAVYRWPFWCNSELKWLRWTDMKTYIFHFALIHLLPIRQLFEYLSLVFFVSLFVYVWAIHRSFIHFGVCVHVLVHVRVYVFECVCIVHDQICVDVLIQCESYTTYYVASIQSKNKHKKQLN